MHLGDKTILQVGEKTFCWMYEDGRAKRIEVETGVIGDLDPRRRQWIEVTNRRAPTLRRGVHGDEPWTPIDGTEQMILGNLSILAEGAPVHGCTGDRVSGKSRMRPRDRNLA